MTSYIEEPPQEYTGLVKEFKDFVELRDGVTLKHIDRLRGRVSDLEAQRNRQGLGGAWQGAEDRSEFKKAYAPTSSTAMHPPYIPRR